MPLANSRLSGCASRAAILRTRSLMKQAPDSEIPSRRCSSLIRRSTRTRVSSGMLFNYRYVNHSIEGLQVYLDHLVKKVWCKADGPFSLDLLHPELKLIVEDISNDDSITKDYLDGPIRRIYEIDAHYKAFVTENKEGKCPYCGCGDIKGVHHSRRDAYDHFLPKGTYPFNSVNFRNLAPTSWRRTRRGTSIPSAARREAHAEKPSTATPPWPQASPSM